MLTSRWRCRCCPSNSISRARHYQRLRPPTFHVPQHVERNPDPNKNAWCKKQKPTHKWKQFVAPCEEGYDRRALPSTIGKVEWTACWSVQEGVFKTPVAPAALIGCVSTETSTPLLTTVRQPSHGATKKPTTMANLFLMPRIPHGCSCWSPQTETRPKREPQGSPWRTHYQQGKRPVTSSWQAPTWCCNGQPIIPSPAGRDSHNFSAGKHARANKWKLFREDNCAWPKWACSFSRAPRTTNSTPSPLPSCPQLASGPKKNSSCADIKNGVPCIYTEQHNMHVQSSLMQSSRHRLDTCTHNHMILHTYAKSASAPAPPAARKGPFTDHEAFKFVFQKTGCIVHACSLLFLVSRIPTSLEPLNENFWNWDSFSRTKICHTLNLPSLAAAGQSASWLMSLVMYSGLKECVDETVACIVTTTGVESSRRQTNAAS